MKCAWQSSPRLRSLTFPSSMPGLTGNRGLLGMELHLFMKEDEVVQVKCPDLFNSSRGLAHIQVIYL